MYDPQALSDDRACGARLANHECSGESKKGVRAAVPPRRPLRNVVRPRSAVKNEVALANSVFPFMWSLVLSR
jgi:hypothetical protein